MTQPAEASLDTRLAALQQLLPTCQRCRRLRRKCDTQLPHCRPCQRAGVECTVYDHALAQALPRAYVQSLLTRIKHLEAVSAGPGNTTAAVNTGNVADLAATAETTANAAAVAPSFDIVVPPSAAKAAGKKSRYWGASSVFALAVEILHHAAQRGHVPVADVVDGDALGWNGSGVNPDPPSGDTSPQASEADLRGLLQLYLASSNTMYGFVDPEQAHADLAVYLAVRRERQQVSFPQPPLSGHAGPYFRITMICAIACATRARHQPWRTAESLAYYADALTYVEDVTAEVSPASLQALLLLIVFCLFFPRKGDVWKLLDYACRLTIELGYHTEGGGEGAEEGTANPPAQLRQSTFWGLYAIERIVGQLFGRGSDLPETIITAPYPSAITPATAMATAAVDRAALQALRIAHHYRLVYLRSELFLALYLPARRPPPPDAAARTRDRAWLRAQVRTLRLWRREPVAPADEEDVTTVTCDVGYDATICFLFQPLLLQALRAAAEVPAASDDPEPLPPVASDPFYAAIRLVRTYDKVVRAPAHSPLGAYPMTFLGAHYICLAASTLLAYALLRLDGRVQTLASMSAAVDAELDAGGGILPDSDTDDNRPTEALDWDAYVDASGACLVLLAWCGERWPGLLGLLGVYQPLFGRTIRALMAEGLV